MTPARDIIVIGASIGGLKAVCQITNGLPPELDASVLIVLHTSPESPRLLADIIGRCTPLAVSYGGHNQRIERGHVYLAPPSYHLIVVAPGSLRLDQGPKEHFSRPAVDALFRSAANVYGPRVIGVVLTGDDGDGTEGLRAIRAAGGLCVVQEPAEAKAPSMPLHAMRDRPDYHVSLDDMAVLLTRLVGPTAAARLQREPAPNAELGGGGPKGPRNDARGQG